MAGAAGAVAAASATDALVDRALDGDRKALDALIAAIHPLVVRYCRSRIGRHQPAAVGADDVAQEVCLAVVSSLDKYQRREKPFLAFVYGIAAHKVADVHRVSARTPTIPVPDIPDSADDAVSPEQQAMRTEAAAQIGDLLAGLPEQQREILRLRVVVGLTAEQTAEALSMSPGSVRVAQHRALARLRSMLTAGGEAPIDQGGWTEVVG